jgi:type 1 glutamine amidotransferase
MQYCLRSIFLSVTFLISTLNSVAQKQFKALLITTTKGWHHESLHYGVVALKEMAIKQEFTVDVFQNPGGFTDENLRQYQVIIFLNTTGNIFDSAQQRVMERFIQSGKGFVGIHSASDTEYDWEWYTKLVGRMFHIHPANQTAKLVATDKTFPGIKDFAERLWTDEWYEFGPEKVTGLQYLLAVDETTYNPTAKSTSKQGVGMGNFHPVAWYHQFDGGRSFYTALGHLPANYSDSIFLQHLFAGIRWAATGKK